MALETALPLVPSLSCPSIPPRRKPQGLGPVSGGHNQVGVGVAEREPNLQRAPPPPVMLCPASSSECHLSQQEARGTPTTRPALLNSCTMPHTRPTPNLVSSCHPRVPRLAEVKQTIGHIPIAGVGHNRDVWCWPGRRQSDDESRYWRAADTRGLLSEVAGFRLRPIGCQ